MPELPEVERARALIAAHALGRRIAAVDDTDTYVSRPHQPGEIAAALTGRTLTAAHRRGKSMWLETDGGDGPILGLHLGMAGRILVDDRVEGDPAPAADGRGWDRFALHFDDGGALVLRDKRRLSRAVLEPRIELLGPDAAEIGRDAFRERVGRGDAPLKARLMDQAVLAGVGNLLADEALWRARLSPLRPAGSLDDAELDRLRRELRAAIRSAIRLGGVHTGELIPHRVAGGHCPRCGAPLRRGKVGGRTTWWCPVEQGDGPEPVAQGAAVAAGGSA
jgi:formamidopyrimidine-DNA glycosylase